MVEWTEEETIGQAVRRLIGVMDERKKRRASGAQSPEKIADPRPTHVPASDRESWPEPSRDRRKTTPGSGQSSDANGEECRGSGLEERCGQDLVGGVTRHRPVEGTENPTTCPRSNAEMVADRFTVPVLNGDVRWRGGK